MNKVDETYLKGLKYVLENGVKKEDRTGVGTISTFGGQNIYGLSEGFPLLTTKRVPFRLVATELLWFISGNTNIKYLIENKNYIWSEWTFKKWIESDEYNGIDMTDFGRRCLIDENFNKEYQKELDLFHERILNDEEFCKKYGDLGNVYGKQWRAWLGADGQVYDQLANVIELIKNNPSSRRIILSGWKPEELDSMALPPCHTMFQFYVEKGKLSCHLYQRSIDKFLGEPFNIASYALLTHMIAHECGLEVGDFIHSFGDNHIYLNHIEQVKEQLSRKPRELPKLKINAPIGTSTFNMKLEDFEIIGYNPHPAIKAPIAV